MSTTASRSLPAALPDELIYPESDGKPMAESTLQYEWIVYFVENIRELFADRNDVFVAGDLLWYPEKGNPKVAHAPDCMVAFGPPPGHRRSYLQWKEGTPPQVCFEVLSHNNTEADMTAKRVAYERLGVEEFYIYDPEEHELRAWERRDGRFRRIRNVEGYRSPRLGIRFWPTAEGLKVERPNGTAFEMFQEAAARAREATKRALEAENRQSILERKLRELGVNPEEIA